MQTQLGLHVAHNLEHSLIPRPHPPALLLTALQATKAEHGGLGTSLRTHT